MCNAPVLTVVGLGMKVTIRKNGTDLYRCMRALAARETHAKKVSLEKFMDEYSSRCDCI